jgi:hypothetical protein
MGASGWEYFVPFQPDIHAALQQLRQTVFDSGDYFKMSHEDWRNMTEEEMLENLQDETDPDIRDMLYSAWRGIKLLPEPTTIGTLLEWNQEAGTHSILDIRKGVSLQPEFGTVSPLTSAQLRQFFGMEQPTHDMVLKWLDPPVDLPKIRNSWEGLYIIIYQENVPTEICFAGFQGIEPLS